MAKQRLHVTHRPSSVLLCRCFVPCHFHTLNQLLESPVDWRADLRALVEFDRGHSALADALRRELEFLESQSLMNIA